MPAKIVVSERKGGSRVSLVGPSGKELLASKVFHEPRAKGATLRALKAVLGGDIVVEDHTLAPRRGGARKAVNADAALPAEAAAPESAGSGSSRAAKRSRAKAVPAAKTTPPADRSSRAANKGARVANRKAAERLAPAAKRL